MRGKGRGYGEGVRGGWFERGRERREGEGEGERRRERGYGEGGYIPSVLLPTTSS